MWVGCQDTPPNHAFLDRTLDLITGGARKVNFGFAIQIVQPKKLWSELGGTFILGWSVSYLSLRGFLSETKEKTASRWGGRGGRGIWEK